MRRRNEQEESGTETRINGLYSLNGGSNEARGFSEAKNPLDGIRLSEFKNEEVDNKMEECTDGFCPMPAASFKTTETNPHLHFFDPVDKPMHYAASSVECIDAIEAQLTKEEFRGYLKGNVAKYMWRERKKGGKESLMKARWYLNRLIDLES